MKNTANQFETGPRLIDTPAVLAGSLWNFVTLWFGSREYREMLWGIPALLSSIVFLFAATAGQLVSDAKVTDNYRAEAAIAYRDGHSERAELWMRKVALLDKEGPETQFNHAILAMQSDDAERAEAIIDSLAPVNKAGHAPAHLYKAQSLLQSFDPKNRLQERVIRHHLQISLKHEPNNVSALKSIAHVEALTGHLDAAIEYYHRLNDIDPVHSFQLAQLLVSAGKQDEAKRVVQKSISQLRKNLKADPSDVQTRIVWARLEGFMERFERCVDLLNRGITLQPPPSAEQIEQLRKELGTAYFGHANLLSKTKPKIVSKRLELLQLAMRFTPEHPQVLESLAQLVRTNSPESESAYEMLSKAIAEGTATPMVHLILSLAAYERGKLEIEQHHLELALAQDPGLVVAMNNLAWRLAVSDPPELEKAFELIEKAVEHAPETAEFRATRGRIHHLLGRHTEAILDLESALTVLKNRPDINDALAQIYEEIGDENLSSHHRNRAKSLMKEKDLFSTP